MKQFFNGLLTTKAKYFLLHPHDLISRIDVNYLPGNGRRAVAGQKQPGRTQFFRQDVPFQRRERRAASVFTGPALMQFTRMRFGPRSYAR